MYPHHLQPNFVKVWFVYGSSSTPCFQEVDGHYQPRVSDLNETVKVIVVNFPTNKSNMFVILIQQALNPFLYAPLGIWK